MSELRGKIERLIVLTDRLADTLAADVKALEQGVAPPLRSLETSVQQMTLLYVREAGSINPVAAKAIPLELRHKLTASTRRMNELLARHQRLITRVRNASEGMIRAVAQEVERRKGSQRSYARTPVARPQTAGAMVYNSVI
jgi:hypothetical protein